MESQEASTATSPASEVKGDSKTGNRSMSSKMLRTSAIAMAVLVAVGAACEISGWRFLASPLQTVMTDALGRRVEMSAAKEGDAPRFRLHLLGHPRIHVGHLTVRNPSWAEADHFVVADDLRITATWSDLWRAYRGGDWRLHAIDARDLDVNAVRRKDGTASWTLKATAEDAQPADEHVEHTPQPERHILLGRLDVKNGTFAYADALLELTVKGTAQRQSDRSKTYAWKLEASGHYKNASLTLTAAAGSAETDTTTFLTTDSVPMSLRLRAGQLELEADGKLIDPMGERSIQANFHLKAPSLAEAGAPLGMILPATPPLQMTGSVGNQAGVWTASIPKATIGHSDLKGEFRYDTSGPTPLLNGRFGGTRLLLQDLGPAIGSTGRPAQADPALSDRVERVIPDKALDLPSLALMNAEVDIDIAQMDLGTPDLRDVRNLRGHVSLKNGVLTLDRLNAELAKGRLAGQLSIDSDKDPPLWKAALTADQIRLERWLQTAEDGEGEPMVGGQLTAKLDLQGEGRSTAAVLANAKGRLWGVWSEGQLSHLLIEAVGLDIADGLGVLIGGDEMLAVQCGALDAPISEGLARPSALVIDTPDSTLWATGGISLATERIAIDVQSRPKDFSLLSLRSPLHIKGNFGQPELKLDAAALLQKAVPAALLATLNPVAALIPLVDTGEDETASKALETCHQILSRYQPEAK